jgi:hypothetical protein
VWVLTADGEIELVRRYFWSKGQGGMFPADASVGLEQSRVSVGARQILCRMGMVQDFRRAAEDARRIGNVPVCRERLRQLVELEAGAIQRQRDGGEIKASWTSADAKVDGSNKTRVYCGIDGVMAPMVTQAEKEKRRRNQCVRRQKRSAAGVGNARGLPPMRPGSIERYREMKIAVFYDQNKERRHVMATAQRHEAFQPLLGRHARQLRFKEADESITLSDGARWIMGAICAVLSFVSTTLLDFYHLSQHVHAAARICLGETPEAMAWAVARLKEFKTLGAAAVLKEMDTLNKRCRSPAKKEGLRQLREYIGGRLDMLDYRTALAQKRDIGSGPTEAMCKTLTLRLKRPGMKWDNDHAAAMMNLTALYDSGQARTYWTNAA